MSYRQDCVAALLLMIEHEEVEKSDLLFSHQDDALAYVRDCFQLDDLQSFIVLMALLYDTYAELMTSIYQTYQEKELYYARVLSLYARLKPLQEKDIHMLLELRKLGFLQPDSSFYLLKQMIALRPYVSFYLNTGYIAQQSGIAVYLPAGMTYRHLYPKIEQKLRAAADTKSDVQLAGRQGSGRHTLLYQLSEHRNQCFLFVNIPLYQQLLNEEQRELYGYAVFYLRLLQAELCLEHPQKEDLMLWQIASNTRYLICNELMMGEGIQIQLPEQLSSHETAKLLNTILQEEIAETALRMTPGECVRYAKLIQQGCSRAQALEVCREQDVSTYVNIVMEHASLQDFYAEQEQIELLRHIIYLITHPDHDVCSSSDIRTLLFYGPSGTGKTMAAAVIAKEAELPLWQIDLSMILDKYIGESEKHLRKIFLAAKRQHAILLFDEADVLFGKRTSISSSHDRYANSSTAFLLQEIERYDGIVILTSNLLHNFDDAFLRRLQFIIRFTLPNGSERRKKWRAAFQKIDHADSLPYDELAEHLELSLAQIEAVAKQAIGFWRASKQKEIKLEHVIKALRLEYQKQQRTLPVKIIEYERTSLQKE